MGDLAEDLQQRALARSVAADDAEHLTRLHREIDVAQGPGVAAPFTGLIFGPLLISLFILLLRIYRVEFISPGEKLED